MIAVVSADHKGLRVIDLFDDDEAVEGQSALRRSQGYSVTVYDADDLRDLCSVLPDRLQTRIAA